MELVASDAKVDVRHKQLGVLERRRELATAPLLVRAGVWRTSGRDKVNDMRMVRRVNYARNVHMDAGNASVKSALSSFHKGEFIERAQAR